MVRLNIKYERMHLCSVCYLITFCNALLILLFILITCLKLSKYNKKGLGDTFETYFENFSTIMQFVF